MTDSDSLWHLVENAIQMQMRDIIRFKGALQDWSGPEWLSRLLQLIAADLNVSFCHLSSVKVKTEQKEVRSFVPKKVRSLFELIFIFNIILSLNVFRSNVSRNALFQLMMLVDVCSPTVRISAYKCRQMHRALAQKLDFPLVCEAAIAERTETTDSPGKVLMLSKLL